MMASPLNHARAAEDLTLAQRCIAGERAAQRELFERERRRVHAVLYRILGSNAHLEDLMQEAFIEIFRSLKIYRGESTLATWVDRCAVRVAYAHLSRKRPRTAQLELVPEVPADDPTAEQRAMAREAARRLYAELEHIEPVHRLAFALHAIDGRPLEEVAKLMDSTVVAAKARVWRARQQLEKRARRDPLLASFLSSESVGDKDADVEEGT